MGVEPSFCLKFIYFREPELTFLSRTCAPSGRTTANVRASRKADSLDGTTGVGDLELVGGTGIRSATGHWRNLGGAVVTRVRPLSPERAVPVLCLINEVRTRTIGGTWTVTR
jgi:hypothetical protein